MRRSAASPIVSVTAPHGHAQDEPSRRYAHAELAEAPTREQRPLLQRQSTSDDRPAGRMTLLPHG